MSELVKSLESLLPTYETILPVSGIKVLFKPFRVKDAKTIAIILQENNKKLALNFMIDLLRSCTENIAIEKLCLADAEYLFLQVRSKSVDEVLNLIKDNEKIQVPIESIKVKNTLAEEKIVLGNNITIYLKTPTVKDLLRLNTLEKDDLVKASIEKINVKNEIYDINKFVPDDIKTVLDNLPMSVVPKLDQFLKKQPELYVMLKTNSGEMEVSGLLNFFTYR
jgi:hypothetical protein